MEWMNTPSKKCNVESSGAISELKMVFLLCDPSTDGCQTQTKGNFYFIEPLIIIFTELYCTIFTYFVPVKCLLLDNFFGHSLDILYLNVFF